MRVPLPPGTGQQNAASPLSFHSIRKNSRNWLFNWRTSSSQRSVFLHITSVDGIKIAPGSNAVVSGKAPFVPVPAEWSPIRKLPSGQQLLSHVMQGCFSLSANRLTTRGASQKEVADGAIPWS